MDDIIYVKVTDENVEQIYTIDTYDGELLDSDDEVVEAEL